VPIEQLNDIELYYESHGEGPVITFLHGAGGNHISWWQQIPVFSQRYRCITIDHRGFNRSTDPQQQGASRFVDDLEVLLERLGVERTALVSQSMGGRTALGYAVRHPDRVWALALCDNWGGIDWPEMREKADALRTERSETPPAPGGMSKRYRSDHPRGAFLYRQIQGLNPPRAESASAPASDAPKPDQVRALTVPTLFLVGSEDPLAPPEIIREVQAIVPDSEYVEVPGSGHSVYFEDAAAFNQHVGAFIDRHANA
jgi:3-oxoadipate enol-lactonase